VVEEAAAETGTELSAVQLPLTQYTVEELQGFLRERGLEVGGGRDDSASAGDSDPNPDSASGSDSDSAEEAEEEEPRKGSGESRPRAVGGYNKSTIFTDEMVSDI
jgi:hypothetical protein